MKFGCPLTLLCNLDAGKGSCLLMHFGSNNHQWWPSWRKGFYSKNHTSTIFSPIFLQSQPTSISCPVIFCNDHQQSWRPISQIHWYTFNISCFLSWLTLSWVTSSEKFHILLPNSTSTKNANVMYSEVLLDWVHKQYLFLEHIMPSCFSCTETIQIDKPQWWCHLIILYKGDTNHLRHSSNSFLPTMSTNSPDSVTIAGVTILQSPQAINGQKDLKCHHLWF